MSPLRALFAVLCFAVACVSALSTPHLAHNVLAHRRRAIVPRNPDLVGDSTVVAPRSNLRRRCKPRPERSSSQAAQQVANVQETKTEKKESKTESPEPTPTEKTAQKPATENVAPRPTTTEKAAEEPTKTTKKAEDSKPTSGGSSGGSSGGVSVGILDGKNTGEATFYGTGLGACGITSKDSDFIVAVSQSLFDSFPGANGNPNKNPICNKKIRATIDGKSVTVTVVDRCVGCKMTDLDFSPSAFNSIADPARGRIAGMTWQWA